MTKQDSVRCPNCGGYDTRAIYDQAYLQAAHAETTLGSVAGTWIKSIFLSWLVWFVVSLPFLAARDFFRSWFKSEPPAWVPWLWAALTIAILLFYAARAWRATAQYFAGKAAMARYPKPVYDGYACNLCKFRWHEGETPPTVNSDTPAKLSLMTKDDKAKRKTLSREGLCADCGKPATQRCELCHLRFCSHHLHKKSVSYQDRDDDTGEPYVWAKDQLCCAGCGNELIPLFGKAPTET